VSRLDGADFSAFRERFRGWTMRTNVVREALARVAAGGEKASLIRSAASVYADPAFLGGRHFGEVMEGTGLPENVIFNATEFHSGIAFRFRRTPTSAARIGNGNFVVPREVAEHVRLADVVAASSCFPGGFEPICFPDEFEWGAEYGLERARAALGDRFRPALPLMDGGVYDNQGVGSSVLANTHGDAATLLISDTNTRQGALYTSPAPASPGRLTLNGTAWLGRILFVLAVASVVALGIHGWRESRQDGGLEWQDVLVYLVPGLFCLAGAAALLWARRVAIDTATRLREQVQIADAWADLRRLTIAQMVRLVELRVLSLLALTSNVFMKRVRGLVYDSVYQDERYKARRASILLYELSEPAHQREHLPWLRPSRWLVDRVRAVDTLATTLWFDSEEQLDTLEHVGSATVAFALLKLIVERHGPEGGAPGTAVRALFDRLRDEYVRLNHPA
jgi:hypothetical protein